MARTMNYPVNGEIWRIFQQTLLISAKKLADDIAKHQGVNVSPLWERIKPQIKISIADIDIPETPVLCPYIVDKEQSIIKQRCRIPCLLGFSACPDHIHSETKDIPSLPTVRRVIDFKGIHYFIDERGIAMNAEGVPKGVVQKDDEEDVLYLFSHACKNTI